MREEAHNFILKLRVIIIFVGLSGVHDGLPSRTDHDLARSVTVDTVYHMTLETRIVFKTQIAIVVVIVATKAA